MELAKELGTLIEITRLLGSNTNKLCLNQCNRKISWGKKISEAEWKSVKAIKQCGEITYK